MSLAPPPPLVFFHPCLDEQGKPVRIEQPHQPSPAEHWCDPAQSLTFIPAGPVPAELNGLAFSPWLEAPSTTADWAQVAGLNPDLEEPQFHAKPGKAISAGVVIEEADGRVWLVHPTNAFGGYQASWPKGKREPGLSLQATAIKEAFEESGLKVELVGFIADLERTTSVARFYRARRTGGSPAQAGWETQAVSLCLKAELYRHLNRATDHPIAQLIGAGPPPANAR